MSIEKVCEDIQLALLSEQVELSSFSLTNYDEDSQADRDRIIVKAEPAQPALLAHDGLTVRQYLVPVGVTIRLTTGSAAQMETLIAAVMGANEGPTAPASAITAGASVSGWRIENLPEGDRENEDKTRTFTSRFAFYVKP